jgi:hypothetical protein
VRITPARVVAACTAIAAGAVAAVQLRTGVIPMLDTVTYWSGAAATADGHPFTTNLAPSFSNFTAVEFLERGGRLPFVDFPLGYPTAAGVVGVAIGVTTAMGMFAVLSAVVLGGLVVLGPRTVQSPVALAVRAAVALGLVTLSAYRLTTQATLSEPIFCALAVGYVVALSRHRDDRAPWWIVASLGTVLGLFRFIGAPLAVLAGVEHYRRHRSLPRAIGWTAAMMVPAAANILWASAAGGGHSAGWRGLQSQDVEVLVRSVGGWLEADQGDLRLTYFGGQPPAWWAWPLTVVWFAAVVVAVSGVLTGLVRPQARRLPRSLELPLAAAGIVTTGLVLGMMGFDALVIPDNRLMLPAGVLTGCGLVWWGTEVIDTMSVRRGLVVLAGVLAWILVAAPPTDVGELFNDGGEEAAYIRAARASGATLVVINDADGTHWATGIPAAYSPLPTKALTGETVDVDAVFRSLPCPLSESNGVLVLADNALFGAGGSPELGRLVEEGRLVIEPFEGGVVYRPTADACA